MWLLITEFNSDNNSDSYQMTMAAMSGERAFGRKTIIIRPHEGSGKDAESRGHRQYRFLATAKRFFSVRKWPIGIARIGFSTELRRTKLHDNYQRGYNYILSTIDL